MDNKNEVVLTGTYKTVLVGANNFEKQVLAFNSKDKEGQWKEGEFETYIKPDLAAQSGIAAGDQVRVKGFLVFNFFTKQDGTQMSFPKLIVTEVQEVEKAQAGAQAGGYTAPQPTQPAGYAGGIPPAPGGAPMAPPAAAGYAQPGVVPGMPIPPMPQP